MKRIVVVLVILVACHSKERKLQQLFPGVYVRAIDHEFAIGSDSISITSLEGYVYNIYKSSRIVRVRNGAITDKAEVRTDKSVGIYDDATGVLLEQREGKQYRFSVKADTLYIGTSLYRKVN